MAVKKAPAVAKKAPAAAKKVVAQKQGISLTNLVFRAAAPSILVSPSPLGLLADLAGTWSGKGFNLIAVPDHQNNKDFRLILNTTTEIIEFNPIGGVVPNRGSAQNDIGIFGLTYLQRVNDANTKEGIHIEPGIWLNVPATKAPPGVASIVRQSTIPHGDSLLAQGTGRTVLRAPRIDPVSSTPFGPGMRKAPLGYLEPYEVPAVPPGMKPEYVGNMNQALVDDIKGQNITQTVTLNVSSATNGGILNIPFVTVNANAAKMDAIFWIETVKRADGSQFLQLQYTQTVILDFLGISWPHISVATLIKT